MLYVFIFVLLLLLTNRVTCPAHLILLVLIILFTLGKEYQVMNLLLKMTVETARSNTGVVLSNPNGGIDIRVSRVGSDVEEG
jgi:hypothetical protein